MEVLAADNQEFIINECCFVMDRFFEEADFQSGMILSRFNKMRFVSQSGHWTGVVFLLLFTLLAAGCNGQNDQISPDAELLAEVDLAAQAHEAAVVGEFEVAETAVTTLTYLVPNVETAVFDLTLAGPDNDYAILHSEDYRTDENGGGSWAQTLPPGSYQLLLTASQTDGTLTVYWEHP